MPLALMVYSPPEMRPVSSALPEMARLFTLVGGLQGYLSLGFGTISLSSPPQRIPPAMSPRGLHHRPYLRFSFQ